MFDNGSLNLYIAKVHVKSKNRNHHVHIWDNENRLAIEPQRSSFRKPHCLEIAAETRWDLL